MKALEKSIYSRYEVCKAFNKIILSDLDCYDGTKKERLKAYLMDLHNGGCQSGMISEFIYHTDCRKFYIEYLDDLESIRAELEDALGEPVSNKRRLPHYTFMCWLCFEQYCFEIYSTNFE